MTDTHGNGLRLGRLDGLLLLGLDCLRMPGGCDHTARPRPRSLLDLGVGALRGVIRVGRISDNAQEPVILDNAEA